MSSQGWAAALQGLQQGLKAGADARSEKDKLALEAALKMRQLQMEQQKLDLLREEHSNKGTTLIPKDLFVDQKEVNSLSPETGFGPTAPGSSSGLGALASGNPILKQNLPAQLKTGLAGLSPGQRVPDILLKAALPQELGALDKIFLNQGFQSNQQAKAFAHQDALEKIKQAGIDSRQDQSNAQTQTKDLIKSVNDLQLDQITKAYDRFQKYLKKYNQGDLNTGEFSDEFVKNLPSSTAQIAEQLPGVGGLATLAINSAPEYLGGRNAHESELASIIQDIQNPKLRQQAGLNQSIGETIRQLIGSGRLGSGAEFGKLLAEDLGQVKAKLAEQRAAFPRAADQMRGAPLLAEQNLNSISGGSNMASDAAAILAKRKASKK